MYDEELLEKDARKMYSWAKTLWPMNRSLTGEGNLKTLNFIKSILKNLKILSANSGKKVFDWKVPEEWRVKDAFIQGKDGKKFCEFKKNNLHLVGYSEPINKQLSFKELSKHLYTLKNQPKLIPYVTSYYEKKWGFCISYNEFKKLKEQDYKVFIDSKHFNGKMHYAELLIKGKSYKEIFFSTNICHPSMANNEISGICLLTAIAKYVKSNFKKPNYSYRFLFIPETIGSINYLSDNYKKMKKKIFAGYTVSCVGDDRAYSLIHSPYENNFSEKILHTVLKKKKNYKQYSFLERGSDERQYCSSLINLPICGFCRSKYGEYPEYHTSGDNFNVLTKNGLKGSLEVFYNIVNGLENSFNKPLSKYECEPFMGKRELYNNTSSKITTSKGDKKMKNFRINLDFLAYANGKNDLFDIANFLNISLDETLLTFKTLKHNKLLASEK
jgi:aminopeptidase-like protein